MLETCCDIKGCVYMNACCGLFFVKVCCGSFGGRSLRARLSPAEGDSPGCSVPARPAPKPKSPVPAGSRVGVNAGYGPCRPGG